VKIKLYGVERFREQSKVFSYFQPFLADCFKYLVQQIQSFLLSKKIFGPKNGISFHILHMIQLVNFDEK